MCKENPSLEMSTKLSPKQEQEIKRLQAMTQQLQILQQNSAQMDATIQESKRALAAIKDLSDDAEIYRAVGSLFFKTSVSSTRSKLEQDIELLEVRVSTTKSQVADLEKKAQELEAQLRVEIGI